jgi:hypothetical protein
LFTFVNIFEARFPINYTNIDKLKEWLYYTQNKNILQS